MTDATTYISAIVLGAGFGINGAVSPGPMQTLLISESLLNGLRSSWRVAISSLVTDPIALTVALFFFASAPDWCVAVIAFAGALVLSRIAWSELQTKTEDFEFHKKQPISFLQIWITNLTNPNLWIYSFTVNGTLISEFWRKGGLSLTLVYLITAYSVMIGCNLTIGGVVGAAKTLFNVKGLVYINRFLGIVLFLLALGFVYTGALKLGLFS